MKNKFYLRILRCLAAGAVIWLCMILCSCVFIDPGPSLLSVSLALPTCAAGKPACISWIGDDMSICTVYLHNTVQDCVLKTAVSAKSMTPILLYIENSNSVLPPDLYGCIYPVFTDMTIHGAFCAQIFMRLVNNAEQDSGDVFDFCSYFNWKKLYEKICTYSNPYLLDMDRIVSDIADRSFTAKSIKLK